MTENNHDLLIFFFEVFAISSLVSFIWGFAEAWIKDILRSRRRNPRWKRKLEKPVPNKALVLFYFHYRRCGINPALAFKHAINSAWAANQNGRVYSAWTTLLKQLERRSKS